MSRGVFIVIEGIDGCGSTTQARALYEALLRHGQRSLLTQEPTSGNIGKLIRNVLAGPPAAAADAAENHAWAELALLFAADRLQHLRQEILPALAHGKVVVSDRYLLSSLIYQSESSPEGSRSIPWLRAVNTWAIPADLTLVLDIPPEVAAERRRSRGGKAELFDDDALQARLRKSYERGAEFVSEQVVVVSGLGELSEVSARVWETTQKILGPRLNALLEENNAQR